MNFEQLLADYQCKTCIMSVERFPDGSYGNIRIAAANKAHCDDMEQTFHRPFVPDSPYAQYLPENKNFEDFCIRSAFQGQPLHTYVRLPQFNLWLNMFLLPLKSDRENIGYCIYSYDVTMHDDSEQHASLSAETSSAVLQTCIKLRGSDNIRQTFYEVIEDIRQICDSDRCCILLTDNETHRCTVFCEALRPDCDAMTMQARMSDNFYSVVKTWKDTLGDSTCIIIKDQRDLDWLQSVNPVWHASLIEHDVSSLVMFPLDYNGKTVGYMMASNFNVDHTVKIKETLELSTFFIASEIANYQLLQKLEILGTIDMLTGVKNRNTMNNTVCEITSGQKTMQETYAVIFADLNGLKRINDEKGHGAGDQLLRNAAAILRGVFFDSEVFRAGGDEFMVIADGIDEAKLALRLKKLEERAAAAHDVHFAVGSYIVRSGEDIRMAMHTADERMYENKNAYYAANPEKKYR